MGEFKIQSGTAVFILIIIGLVLTMWVGSWECNNDKDCNIEEICTVKHICYKPAIIEKTIYITENKYTTAALIIGICIIISAVILKKEENILIQHLKKIIFFKSKKRL